MNATTNLVMLPVERLYPHPDNPRKDVGDVTELAESIKARGIMQNLTVVPYADAVKSGYMVIIGHRRLAASKLAGLKEVPCVIADMSEKEQLATMLLENMQRSDLTIYEQAQGFQLMIDLGESIKDISEKTGFSETTVRRRVKLMRYDRDAMLAAQVRQPTMEQYLKLAEIEDDDEANEVLRHIGTKNFDSMLASALGRQRERRAREALRTVIAKYAEKLSDASYNAIKERDLVSVASFYVNAFKEDEIANLAMKHEKLYYAEGYGFTVYRDSTDEDDKRTAELDAKREARNNLEHRANEMYRALKERAAAWIDEYTPKKGDLEILTNAMFDAFISNYGSSNYFWGLHEALGGVKPDNYYDDLQVINAESFIYERFLESREKTMLITLWRLVHFDNPAVLRYNSHSLEWNTSRHTHHMWLFSLLDDLGYNVSDDEWAFLNGSHPIYSEEVPL